MSTGESGWVVNLPSVVDAIVEIGQNRVLIAFSL